MCLIVFAHKVHEEFPLVMLANRDEFYQRPTTRADWWAEQPHLLAGKDLQAGGTWMGVTKTGRIAAITNFREPNNIKENAPSRGALVTDFLLANEAPIDYLNRIAQKGQAYNGFNLIVSDANSMAYYSNRGEKPEILAPGIYGLSNHLLDTPWPKVVKVKNGFTQMIHANRIPNNSDPFFDLMLDGQRAADKELPDTGISLEWERLLSPLFIESPAYGTRVSTFLKINQKNQLSYEERAYVPRGEKRAFEFEIVGSALLSE
jgi:uncharacterized protein with NRDE domain